MVAERAFWLAWSKISGVGPVLLRRLVQEFGSLSAAWSADQQALGAVEGIGPQTLTVIQTHRRQTNPETLLAQHQQANPNFWTPADPEYPRLLLEVADPPALLYYRGEVDPLENQGVTPAIAIVGTREPSEYGKRWTEKLARTLAENRFTVVSGLAEGIDTYAHTGCLEAGGRTIAVLGTGVDLVYPPRNRGLYQQVLQQGVVLSEYPSGTQPDRVHFPRRNRIIAGLCRAVLIMEAASKSGALITARLANDYGRDVYVLPGSLDNPKAIGCLGLVNRGAQVILSAGHLLELLGAIPQLDQPAPSASAPIPDLPPDLATVLETLRQLTAASAQPAIGFDLLVQTTALNPGAVSSALLQLELLGLVSQQPGMRYLCR
ncbi:MAG: DNA-processing protein DprA [Aphanocapsa sp. GSE-SYN-MK-11-07L]|jgi:DNA processing protein|nr:DNA-processing protein DprA [Aphanocapsa sp. GSE-SYN-MK-11-07L]